MANAKGQGLKSPGENKGQIKGSPFKDAIVKK